MRFSRYNVVVTRPDRVWVYNSLSGMTVSVSPAEWQLLTDCSSGDGLARQSESLMSLAHGRMIVNDDLDELEVLERRFRAGTGDRTSFALTVVTSLGCNFDCPYCFQVKPRAILDDETVGLLVEVLEEQLPTIERFQVTWFGGEPLLATDRIDE